jgi:solute carrier family 25 protein 38
VMPLTVVKTRIEAGDRTLGGTFTTMRAIYKADTLRGLYRGVLPTVLRDAPASGVYLTLYSKILDAVLAVPGVEQAPRFLVNFSSGIAAGAIATALTNPPDVVRTRMQLQEGPMRRGPGKRIGGGADLTAWEVARDIVRRNGVAALFTRGLAPRVIKKSLQVRPGAIRAARARGAGCARPAAALRAAAVLRRACL